jgi:hypothetical protein
MIGHRYLCPRDSILKTYLSFHLLSMVYGYGAVDARAARLERLKHQHIGGQVDPIGGQCQRLKEPATGIGILSSTCRTGIAGTSVGDQTDRSGVAVATGRPTFINTV